MDKKDKDVERDPVLIPFTIISSNPVIPTNLNTTVTLVICHLRYTTENKQKSVSIQSERGGASAVVRLISILSFY